MVVVFIVLVVAVPVKTKNNPLGPARFRVMLLPVRLPLTAVAEF